MDTTPWDAAWNTLFVLDMLSVWSVFELFAHTRNRRRLATDEIIAAMDGCGLGGVCTARPRRSIYDVSEASQAFPISPNTLNWRHSLQRKPPEVGK